MVRTKESSNSAGDVEVKGGKMPKTMKEMSQSLKSNQKKWVDEKNGQADQLIK